MKHFVIVSAVFCVVLCAACGHSTPENEAAENAAGSAEIYMDSDNTLDLCIYNVDSLNPLKTSAKPIAEVLSLLYDSLYIPQSDFTAEKNIAVDFSLSENALTATVVIKQNVTFQNGEFLTAEDVCASLNTLIDAKGYYQKRLTMIDYATWEDGKVLFHLNTPTENLQMLLDFPILPKSEQQSSQEKTENLSIAPGSGFYKLTQYDVGSKLVLTANPTHHSGTVPTSSSCVIHLLPNENTALSQLESGNLDAVAKTRNAIYTPRKAPLPVVYPGLDFTFIGIHPKIQDSLSSKTLARIMWALKDATLFLKTETEYEASQIPTHPNARSYPTHTSAPPTFKTFSPLQFTILVNRESSQKKYLAKEICRAFLTVGIELSIKECTLKEMEQFIRLKQYELYLGETTLLPNFDRHQQMQLTKADFTSETKPNVIGLYFKNEVLFVKSGNTIPTITTLNPYLSLIHWTV